MKILAILLMILASEQFVLGYKILAVFPLNGKSHWLMADRILKGLAKRGHQVDVISNFPQKKPIPNYNDIIISGPVERAVNNMTAEFITKFSSMNMKQFVHLGGTRICKLMEKPELMNPIKNPPQDPPYDLIITELFIAPCYLAYGRHLKIPMVTLVASAFHDWLYGHTGTPLNTAFVPGLFSSFTQNMTFWERLQNTLITTLITTQINYYSNEQLEDVKRYFGIDLESIDELYKDISLILVNSHHSLHGIKPMNPAVIDVAGVHISEDDDPLSPEVQKWLDESKDGCVFFTFGSMVRIETFPNETIKEFYKAFENIAPVRVLMKVAKKEDLLPGLPKNVMIQPWFPQVHVLKHKNTKAFITHGGLLGTQESIYYGVPLIGIPLFGDQHFNIQNYVNKKIAVSFGSIQNVTAEGLTNALKTILYDPSYRNNIRQLSSLFKDRPMPALDTAIYWIEYVGRHGKILQSPGVHLTWWQFHLIDVYGFIAVCVIATLAVVLFVLRLVKNKIFGSKTCSRKHKIDATSKKNK